MKTILVVEDEASIAELLCMLLEDAGYRSIVARNGKEALEKLRVSQLDLVLSDLMMPVLDGWGLMEAMRADPGLQEVPIILLSAVHPSARPTDPEIHFLAKPFDPDELLTSISQLLSTDSSHD